MILAANFNLMTQCPQVYIYVFAVVTSALVSLKLCDKKQAMWTIISGIITTIILMGINICNWNFQFITWIFSLLFILISALNILVFFFATPEQLKEIKEN
jgi:uncharacterized membrane protein